MEESEKRRERLKAMRMEAAQVEANNAPETSGLLSGGLSNPLIESTTVSTTPLQYNAPRFDYYTDPMSAFSGNKRRNDVTPQVSRGHFNIPPRIAYQGLTPGPVHQYPAINSPGQSTFQAPPTNFNQGPPGTQMGAIRPFSRPQVDQPHAWGGSGGTFQYNPPPYMHRGNNFASPRFYGGNSPVSYSRGRGQWHNSSPQYMSGRGGVRYPDSGRGRGRSGMRGGGSHRSTSAEQQPDLYFSKYMLEDPWESLTPVVWKGIGSRDHEKSWLPKSISMKKAKVSPESSKMSIPQPSLAEYLAASFNDTIEEPADDEQGT